MSKQVCYELCPETGIGTLVISNESCIHKFDLMPDEAESLKELIKAGDRVGAKALLVGVDPSTETVVDDVCLDVLIEEIG